MKYGAKGAKWAPVSDLGDSSTKPTYGDVKEFDGLNESEDSLSMATASAYGDNMEKIYISEFSSGDLSVKAVQIDPDIYSAVLGAETDSDGGLIYGSEDEQPFGAYGFYANKMGSDKTKYYEVNFYPKVMGVLEGSTSKTKEDNITLEYEAIKFRVQSATYQNAFKITKQFTTEAAAQAYLAGLFDGTSEWPEAVTA